MCAVLCGQDVKSGQEAVQWLHGSRHSVVYGAVLCCDVVLLCCVVRSSRQESGQEAVRCVVVCCAVGGGTVIIKIINSVTKVTSHASAPGPRYRSISRAPTKYFNSRSILGSTIGLWERTLGSRRLRSYVV